MGMEQSTPRSENRTYSDLWIKFVNTPLHAGQIARLNAVTGTITVITIAPARKAA